jgi:transcription initiation factor TFIIIB Brf1 subunit/transcription initiation factor TFIIB
MDIPDYEWHPPPAILVPHADHGDPDCPGLILPEVSGDQANLVCNDCGAVIRTVPASEAEQTLAQMAASEICSAECPICGELNIFQGFSVMLAYTCRHCGAGVEVQADKVQ